MPAFFRHNDFTLPTHQTPFQFCNETSLAYFDWLLAHPEAHDRFITGMQGNRLGKPFWATWYPVRERILHSFDATTNSPFFVDIGGNTGYDLVRLQTELANIDADIVRAQYGSKPFVLQDLARVIESIQEEELCRLNRAGIRCEKYDFFTPQRTKGIYDPSPVFEPKGFKMLKAYLLGKLQALMCISCISSCMTFPTLPPAMCCTTPPWV